MNLNKTNTDMEEKILELMYNLEQGNINYKYASKQVLDLFSVSNNSGIKVHTLLKRVKMPKRNGCQLKLYTIGKVYKVERIKYNYRYIKKAIGLRSDDGVLRWLSQSRVVNEHEIVYPLLLTNK